MGPRTVRCRGESEPPKQIERSFWTDKTNPNYMVANSGHE